MSFVDFCVTFNLFFKENRYSLLPWLVVAAITITMHFLTAFYLILYGTFDITMVGLTLVAASGKFFA